MNNQPQACEIFITRLKAQNEGAEIALGVEIRQGEECEHRCLVLSVEDYYSLKPQKGKISEETFDLLEKASKRYQALRCGVNLLSYGSNSGGSLRKKLRRRGYSNEEADAAIERLCATGVLNEAEDLKREVERDVKKLWGERRIRAQIFSKGYCRETLEALDELFEGIDFVNNCKAYLLKKYREIPTERVEYAKMMASVLRFGYSPEEVKKAIAMIRKEK